MAFDRRRKARLARSILLAVAGAGTALPVNAQQASGKIRLTSAQAAASFGVRESVISVSLSPDGTKIATVEPNSARGVDVLVTDLTNPGKAPVSILYATGDPERIDRCGWTGVNRLLCEVYGSAKLDVGFTYFNRFAALDADGKNMQAVRLPGRASNSYSYGTYGGQIVAWNTGKEGHVLMARYYAQQGATGTIITRDLEGLGVDDIDTTNLRTSTVEKAKSSTTDYISDGLGTVRIMASDAEVTRDGYSSGKTKFFYRLKGENGWQDLSVYDHRSREGFEPRYVDPGLNLAYGLKKADGRLAAYSVALDGSKTETLLLSRPDVDVSGFATIGRNHRVVGVTYSTESGQVAYLDPQIKRLVAALGKAMPHLPLINVIDSSQDERKLLIFASSDVDPGHYFVLDRDTNGMVEVAMSRLPLEKVALASVKAVTVRARDGAAIPAYLTLPPGSDGKNLPAIVMPHGGPGSRDEWGFDWLSQFWAQIGYAVLQPNFRGSAGYGDAWFQQNGFQSWKVAIGDVDDSGRWLIAQGIADPKRLAIFGWSYGGYAALQSAVADPGLFRAVVAVAPVTDLGLLKEDSRNWVNFLVTKDFIGSGPHIDEGSPARQAGKVTVPVLMFHGTYDRNVNYRQSELMADRLQDAGKAGRLVTYDKLDHYLEDSAARQDMLNQAAAFIEQAFNEAK